MLRNYSLIHTLKRFSSSLTFVDKAYINGEYVSAKNKKTFEGLCFAVSL